MIKKLLQEGLSAAFTKCLEDNAVMNWTPYTQRDLMSACVAFMELSAQKLKVCNGWLMQPNCLIQVD